MPVPALSHPEAQLLKRNEKLEELWEMDEEIRYCRANGTLTRGQQRDAMTERQIIAQELKEMGVVPWEWHPDRDNSWLVMLRSGVTE